MSEMAKVMQKNEEVLDDDKTARFKIEKELKDERKKLFFKAIRFFRENTAHIEIHNESGGLEKTYFYIPPFCHAMTPQTKDRFQ